MSENNDQFDKIVDTEISQKMKSSYIEYAMSVIVSRALPDVRDGLKPVHRRILYSMHKLNLDPSKSFRKCANIVGDTMAKYHPHGDSAIYESLVRMAQDFSMRYVLVDGLGNFGSIDGHPAAAYRYTEAKLTKMSADMLVDIDKNTVDFVSNYDGSTKEPTVLPSRFPNLLVNGSSGIAVGMATNIPPHNITEILDASLKIINNEIIEKRDTEIAEILEIVKGPDFPTGATILGKAGILNAYTTGKGKIRIRSKCKIETGDNGRERIIITEIPYQTNKSRMIEKIAELARDKKVEGISAIEDETDRKGIKIIIECKKDASANVILNTLYKNSQLQENYSINLLAIVDGEPKTLNIKEMLMYYLNHQEEVVMRKTKFEYDKASKRLHIVKGLLKSLAHIDEIIEIIKSNKDIKEAKIILIDKFSFTQEQVEAICEMRLKSLSGLEKDKLDNERNDLTQFIEQKLEILNNRNRLLEVIREDIEKIKSKYSDNRKTELVADEGDLFIEDFIEDEMSVITITNLNYVKRVPLTTYKSQNRGGKGIIGIKTRDEDFVKNMFLSSNHNFIYFFTNRGRVYRIKTFEISETTRTSKGTPIVNIIPLMADEKVTTVIPVRQNKDKSEEEIAKTSFLAMATKNGIIKRTNFSMFKNIRKSGIIAINLREDDELISVKEINEDSEMFIVTRLGMSIRFDLSNIRELSRNAAGVKAINLNKEDVVIASEVVEEDKKILIVSEKGFGKCTVSEEYKKQKRGGKGLKTYKITEKTGDVIDVKIIEDSEEIIMSTTDGVVIRIRARDISTSSRITQGVKLINLDGDIKVVSVAQIASKYIEEMEEQENQENQENQKEQDTN